MKPRALDLFCGADGASMGLHRAGFDVVGVDIKRQPRYPFAFVRADALQPPFDLSEFDLIWASPPCQAYSRATPLQHRDAHPKLVEAVRALLRASGRLYVIENVPGAPLYRPVILCGSSFGLRVRRHRWFETPIAMLAPSCSHRLQGQPLDVTGHGGRRVNRKPNDKGGRLNAARTVIEAREGMGMEHGTYQECAQAVPPAYAEFIGRAALAHLQARAA